jgi:hypothetical protein
MVKVTRKLSGPTGRWRKGCVETYDEVVFVIILKPSVTMSNCGSHGYTSDG